MIPIEGAAPKTVLPFPNIHFTACIGCDASIFLAPVVVSFLAGLVATLQRSRQSILKPNS